MPQEELNRLFNAQPSFILPILIYDISQFNLRVIQWEAEKQKRCTHQQWIAYHMKGYEYVDDKLHLIFECKAFDDDAGLDIGDHVPLRYWLPPNWGQCDSTED